MKCVGQAKVPWLSKERPRSSMRSIPLRLIDSVEVELEITRMKVNKRDRRNHGCEMDLRDPGSGKMRRPPLPRRVTRG